MSTEKEQKNRLRAEIARLAGTVPKDKFQTWGSTTAANYKAECKKARALVAKAGATTAQLSSQLNAIKTYWQ